jgi:hypothetical protein
VTAVRRLKERLEADNGLVADTDQQIVALARDADRPWARYVDPALSRAKLLPTNGSLIVLWECADHVIGLHDRGGKKWKVIADQDEIEYLRDYYEDEYFDDDDLLDYEDDTDEESNELPDLSVDLTEEDRERRRLVSSSHLDQLEQISPRQVPVEDESFDTWIQREASSTDDAD